MGEHCPGIEPVAYLPMLERTYIFGGLLHVQ